MEGPGAQGAQFLQSIISVIPTKESCYLLNLLLKPSWSMMIEHIECRYFTWTISSTLLLLDHKKPVVILRVLCMRPPLNDAGGIK